MSRPSVWRSIDSGRPLDVPDQSPIFRRDSITAGLHRNRPGIRWADGVDDDALPPGRSTVSGPEPGQETADSERIFRVPLGGIRDPGQIRISSENGRISLYTHGALLQDVLAHIAESQGLNIVTSGPATTPISVTLTDVELEDALNVILAVAGYTWIRQKDIVVISPIASDSGVSPAVQGRKVRVFPLNFVAAADVQATVTGLLSPIGQSFITAASPTDRKRTRELIVVEDLPEYIERIEEFVYQVDQPPRQVLIEAYILQVKLNDTTRHGVDFNLATRIANTNITLRTRGFANAAANPAFFLGIDGTDLEALVEALKETTNAKTLASPKVLVVNGQDARIQIGERFGYLVTTTTETSTLQNVDFLDVGVVLNVTPQISDDNQVLMTIRPEVSSGRISLNTGLPEEETTEVETTILLPDGHGIVIGGLIQESMVDEQSKIPILGDLWLIGKLFQRQNLALERSEIIIAIVPHVVPYASSGFAMQSETELSRATTRLFAGPLWETERPWEPRLPNAMKNPRRLKTRRLPHIIRNLGEPLPHPPEYYFPTLPEEASWIPPLLIDGFANSTIIDGGHAPNFIENDTPTTNGVPARTMKPAGTDHYNLPAPFRYE